jgi:hypothetical protein
VKEAMVYLAGTYQFNSLESAPLGTHLGRIKANDPDMGENAELEYSIAEGEGSDMFDVITDKDTQEGIITVKQVSFACLSIFSKCSLVYSCFSVQRKTTLDLLFIILYLLSINHRK